MLMKSLYSAKIRPVIGAATILLALYTVLMSGAHDFSEEKAGAIIARISDNLSTNSSRSGAESGLKYGAIEIKGIAYDKWAKISDLALSYFYHFRQEGTRLGISTHSANMLPDHTNSDNAALQFQEAINLIISSELFAVITPEKPVLYNVSFLHNAQGNAVEYAKHNLAATSALKILRLNPKKEETLDLSHGAKAEIILSKSKRSANAHLVANAAKFLSGADVWSINSGDLRYEGKQKSADSFESNGTVTVDKLTFQSSSNSANFSTSPLTAVASWIIREQQNSSGETDNLRIIIDHGLITNGSSKISINGEIAIAGDNKTDGEIIVEITEPDMLLESDWIIPQHKDELRKLLDSIAGFSVQGHKQVIITIKPDKDSYWQIGKIALAKLLEQNIANLFIFGEKEQNAPEEKQQKI